MEIFIERTGKTTKLVFHGKVKVLLKKLKLNPESVLVIRNTGVMELLTKEDIVMNKDKIKIISVISGG